MLPSQKMPFSDPDSGIFCDGSGALAIGLPRRERRRGVGRVQAPQRRPGVMTGASQSRTSSSSAFNSVTEQPAMSSEVM